MNEVNKIKNIHPLSKIWLIPLIIFSVVLFRDWRVNLLLFVFLCAIALAGDSLLVLLKSISSSVLILCITIFIMQLLFFKQGGTHYFRIVGFDITENGLNNALLMSTNILTMAVAFLVFFKLTKEEDLVNALEDRGFNHKACFILLSTFQMIPQMKKYSNVIMDAQRSRGIETEGSLIIRMKALIPSLGPLILASIASTDERAITLETRGFSVEGKKTKLTHTSGSSYDKAVNLFWIIFLAAVIITKIVCSVIL